MTVMCLQWQDYREVSPNDVMLEMDEEFLNSVSS